MTGSRKIPTNFREIAASAHERELARIADMRRSPESESTIRLHREEKESRLEAEKLARQEATSYCAGDIRRAAVEAANVLKENYVSPTHKVIESGRRPALLRLVTSKRRSRDDFWPLAQVGTVKGGVSYDNGRLGGDPMVTYSTVLSGIGLTAYGELVHFSGATTRRLEDDQILRLDHSPPISGTRNQPARTFDDLLSDSYVSREAADVEPIGIIKMLERVVSINIANSLREQQRVVA